MAESSLSLVSKTNGKNFPVRFSSHPGQVFVSYFETLTNIFFQVVLDTRDIEDSANYFGFPVSTHTKKYCTFEKISQKCFQTKNILFYFCHMKGW